MRLRYSGKKQGASQRDVPEEEYSGVGLEAGFRKYFLIFVFDAFLLPLGSGGSFLLVSGQRYNMENMKNVLKYSVTSLAW